MEIYKLCQYLGPIAIRSLENTVAFDDIREKTANLKHFINDDINNMSTEWNKYTRFCNNIPVRPGDSNFNVKINCASTFWKLKSPEIPHLSKLAKYCFTITTSSAAAETVFSRLKSALSLLQVNFESDLGGN